LMRRRGGTDRPLSAAHARTQRGRRRWRSAWRSSRRHGDDAGPARGLSGGGSLRGGVAGLCGRSLRSTVVDFLARRRVRHRVPGPPRLRLVRALLRGLVLLIHGYLRSGCPFRRVGGTAGRGRPLQLQLDFVNVDRHLRLARLSVCF
jgi:hypothetical protein